MLGVKKKNNTGQEASGAVRTRTVYGHKIVLYSRVTTDREKRVTKVIGN